MKVLFKYYVEPSGELPQYRSTTHIDNADIYLPRIGETVGYYDHYTVWRYGIVKDIEYDYHNNQVDIEIHELI